MEGSSSSSLRGEKDNKKKNNEEEEEEEEKKPWSWTEYKVFQLANGFLPENDEKRWEIIAAQLPGRSPEEVKEHHRQLLMDVILMNSGPAELANDPYDAADPQQQNKRLRIGSATDVETQQSQETQQEGTGNSVVQATTQQSQEMHQEGTSNADEADAERTK